MLELRGSIRILPMCSEFSRPARAQDLPPSFDLYKPSPKLTLRWLLFSPVPSQTTFESLGSTVTAPSEYAPYLSKIGVKVLPRFSVFHRLPAAAAPTARANTPRHTRAGAARRGELMPEIIPSAADRLRARAFRPSSRNR